MLSFEATGLKGAKKSSNGEGPSTPLGMTTYLAQNMEGRGAKLTFFICYFARAPRPSKLKNDELSSRALHNIQYKLRRVTCIKLATDIQ